MSFLCKTQRTMLKVPSYVRGAKSPPSPPRLTFIGPHSFQAVLAASKHSGPKSKAERSSSLSKNQKKNQRNRTKLTASPDLIGYLTNPQSYSFVHGWRLEGWDHLLHRLCLGRRNGPERRRDCSPPCHVFGPLFTFGGHIILGE